MLNIIIRKSIIVCLILLAMIGIMSKQIFAMEAYGVVRPSGPDICMQGTHWLINDGDNSKVKLQSSTIDIEMFVNQYVRVEGENVGIECIVIEVVNIEILSISSTISGFVTDPDHLPIQGARIRLRQRGAVIDTARTDANGYYKFIDVADGKYVIIGRKVEYNKDRKVGKVVKKRLWGKDEFINLILIPME